MTRLKEALGRIYRGDTEIDFVGRTRLWYGVAGGVVVVCLLSLLVLRLNLGIEFTGGAEFRAPAGSTSVAEAREAVGGLDAVGEEPVVQEVGPDLRVQTPELTEEADVRAVQEALAGVTGVEASDVTVSTVGAAWGSQITTKALQGLAFFMIVVVVYLSLRFEPKMAAAALVALVHDLVVTIGVFSLLRFEVTPATVIGLLTILGYSLYDTVVVFDKVKENTSDLLERGRTTYSEAANRSVNQMLARSINTSVIALLPVAGLLFVGAGLLGAGTLLDLSLALFVGIAAGTYSSIFIATPVLVDLKEREDAYGVLRRGVANRRRKAGTAAGAGAGSASTTATAVSGSASGPSAAGAPRRGSVAVRSRPEQPDDDPAPAHDGAGGDDDDDAVTGPGPSTVGGASAVGPSVRRQAPRDRRSRAQRRGRA